LTQPWTGTLKILRASCKRSVRTESTSTSRTWPAVLPLLNRYARVPVCGLIALYNGVSQAGRDWLPDTMLTVLRRSLLIRGFINTEFVSEHYSEFLREIEPMVATGRIRYREHMVDGLDAAPSAFIGMLEGRNFGKVIVKLVQ
jgi:NADPH-dependent curcumin reductase CurA